jgi:hypothetical protein
VGPHSGFSPDPVIDVPPDWEQAFTRFTSLFAAMYLFAIPHAQFENGIAHVFKADHIFFFFLFFVFCTKGISITLSCDSRSFVLILS